MNEVDVLLPVFGKPLYISETLDSIIIQPNINKILLILDRVDEKYFKNLDLINKYNNLSIFVSTKPGIVNALNTGLKKSSAEFIARIDADDIMMPGRITSQLNFLLSNPSYVCIGSSIRIFGNVRKSYIKNYHTSNAKINNHLLYQNAMAHPSVMYRRVPVLEVKGYRPLFEGAEDYDLWFRLSKIGKLGNLREPLTKYRINSGQYSNSFAESRVKLDSLVRLFNIASIEEKQLNFFDKPLPLQDLSTLYADLIEVVKIKNFKVYKLLINAEKFGALLVLKSYYHNKILYYPNILYYSVKIFLNSPVFILKVILEKISR
jgi:glycosyltransferase involved in cell wall biosynthesis